MDAKIETAKKLEAQLKIVESELAGLCEKFNACTDKGKLKKYMNRGDVLTSKKAHILIELEDIRFEILRKKHGMETDFQQNRQ